jgi:hypothetical protein
MTPSLRDGIPAVLVPRREGRPQREENHRSEWHRDWRTPPRCTWVYKPASRRVAGRGARMELRSFVAALVETVWQLEQRTHRQMDAPVLGLVRDAVAVELEYRRRMQELDRRLGLLAEPVGATRGE